MTAYTEHRLQYIQTAERQYTHDNDEQTDEFRGRDLNRLKLWGDRMGRGKLFQTKSAP